MRYKIASYNPLPLCFRISLLHNTVIFANNSFIFIIRGFIRFPLKFTYIILFELFGLLFPCRIYSTILPSKSLRKKFIFQHQAQAVINRQMQFLNHISFCLRNFNAHITHVFQFAIFCSS